MDRPLAQRLAAVLLRILVSRRSRRMLVRPGASEVGPRSWYEQACSSSSSYLHGPRCYVDPFDSCLFGCSPVVLTSYRQSQMHARFLLLLLLLLISTTHLCLDLPP